MVIPPKDCPAAQGRDGWSLGLLALATVLLCWPLLGWVLTSTGREHQLLNALAVLVFFVFITWTFRERGLRPVWELDRRSATLFVAASGLTALAIVTPFNWAYLLAFGVLVYAWLWVVYGASERRMILAVSLSFTLFLVLMMIFPALDLPLRLLAGQHAYWLFQGSGYSTDLLFQVDRDAGWVRLILIFEGRPFEVAPECNGFGMMGSGLLIGTLLVLVNRPGWVRGTAGVLLAVVCGYAANMVRIALILLLAPWAGAHYDLMHEVVGTLLYVLFLLAVWIILSSSFFQVKPVDHKL